MSDTVYWLLAMALIAAGIIIVVMVLGYLRRRSQNGPMGLLWSLCQAHKLKWSDRWLLWRLARLEHLTDPAQLFLEPEWFNSSGLPGELRPKAAQIRTLYNRLFAGMKETGGPYGDGQTQPPDMIETSAVELPVSKTAPQLDVPPWQASATIPPLPPPSLTNSSDGTSV